MKATRMASGIKAGSYVFIAVVLVLGLLPRISLAQDIDVAPVVDASEDNNHEVVASEQLPESTPITTILLDEEGKSEDSLEEILPENFLGEIKTLATAQVQPQAFAASFPVSVDSTNFPDPDWRAFVKSNLAGGDNELTQTEAEAVQSIVVTGKKIGDLTGIEWFTNLTDLYCNENSLTSLDVTSLTKLGKLYCGFNSLTYLNVRGLSDLQVLNCNTNALTTLDLTGLSSLQDLSCHYNFLTSLDLRSHTNLKYLYCHNNSLRSLNVTGLSKLERFFCGNNFLSSLNAAGLSNVVDFGCENNVLTSLDVTGQIKLQNLYCQNNILNSLDVSSLSQLKYLSCHTNVLTALDVSGLSSLTTISCYKNSLLQVKGASSKPSVWPGQQTKTIQMIPSPSGGFMSESAYTFEPENVIGGFGQGVTFVDGYFYTETSLPSSPFVTTLGGTSYSVSGVLSFTLATYSVTFLNWDSSILDQQTIEAGSSADAPAEPTREGYTFIGWDTLFDYVTGDLVIKPLFKEKLNPAPIPDQSTTPVQLVTGLNDTSTLAETGDTPSVTPVA